MLFELWILVRQQFNQNGTLLQHQISKLFFKLCMSIRLVCVVVSAAKFTVEKVFSPAAGHQKIKKKNVTKTLEILTTT